MDVCVAVLPRLLFVAVLSGPASSEVVRQSVELTLGSAV